VRGFPAVIDAGTSVQLRVMESPQRAAEATRAGLRRLFLLQVGEQAKYLQRHLPGIERMCLQYATIGPCDELKRDILMVAADRALFGDEGVIIRRRDDFVSRAERAWQSLSESAREVCAVVGDVLERYQALAQRLTQPAPPFVAPNLADEREHLANLLPRGFVASTPWGWLKHFPRFLQGAELRLKKLLNAGATRDTQMMEQVRPLWKQYVNRLELHRFQGIEDAALQQYRWMLEELRVSLFAQELKTSQPASVKRLEQLFAEVR
jgi:ATP-dependent helicase HrpA